MISIPKRPVNIAWDLLIAALLLLVLYFVVAGAFDNFRMAEFNYFTSYFPSMFGMPVVFFISQFWKILLLLPATILLSVVLARTGIKFNFSLKNRYHVAVGSLLVVATVILVLSIQLVFRETEVTDDENTYDFQAKTILLGRAVNPPLPVKNNFDNQFIINNYKEWVGKYTLGHPLIIAIGLMLGNRYIAIILISILTLLLFYFISLDIYRNKKIAFLTICLGAVSPFFYLVSSSRLSHTTSLFFLALFMFLFLRSRDIHNMRKGVIFAFLSGIALGYAFNVRTLTAIGFALPFCAVSVIDLHQNWRKTLLKSVSLIAGFMIMLVLTLWYNSTVTNKIFTFPFHYYNINESLGFGVQGHTLIFALRNLTISIGRLNPFLLGFPLGLIFIFIFLFSSKKEFGDKLLFGILSGIAVAYLFYFSPGVSDLGPVYYYETMLPLLLLTSRGIVFLQKVITGRFSKYHTLVPYFLILSFVFSIITFIPERIDHVYRLTEQIREPYETVRSANIHHALIMIRSWPKKGWIMGYRNPSPALDDDVIYCRYADSTSNYKVMNLFSDRTFYSLVYNAGLNRSEIIPLK